MPQTYAEPAVRARLNHHAAVIAITHPDTVYSIFPVLIPHSQSATTAAAAIPNSILRVLVMVYQCSPQDLGVRWTCPFLYQFGGPVR